MYRRARRLLIAGLFGMLPCAAGAQTIWQPTPPPLVTAENESWFRAGGPIEWNGDLYYPAGAAQGFDRVQMVRAGSYRGIPLYTDVTLEPYSIVFDPIAGGGVQPYERPRAGHLADSTGSRAPSFPPQTFSALTMTSGGFIAQAPSPPLLARPYDLAPTSAPETTPGSPSPAAAVGTGGRSIVTTTNRPVSTAEPPKGINGAWLEYDGRRWVALGKAIELTADFQIVGTYRGFPVYARNGDRSTIYIASTPGLVVPYSPRGR
jgi:hypothetical protein